MSHTERVRGRLREAMDVCPTCHRPSEDTSLRTVADAAGVSHSTVARFLRGHAVRSDSLDAIEAWLNGEPMGAGR